MIPASIRTATLLTLVCFAQPVIGQETDNPVCSESFSLDKLVTITGQHANEIRGLREVDHEAITFRHDFEDSQGRQVQFVYYAEAESMTGFTLFVDGPRNNDAFQITGTDGDFRADAVDGAFPGEYTFQSVQFFTCEFLRRMRIDLEEEVN